MRSDRVKATKRSVAACLLGLLVVVCSATPRLHARANAEEKRGRLQGQWRYWKYFREIRLPPTAQTRLVALLVPVMVYQWSRPGLADLRLVDDAGNEIGYAKFTFVGGSSVAFLPSFRLKRQAAPGQYADFVLDLGPHPRPYNCLSVIRRAGAVDVGAPAEIDSSEDGIRWQPLRKRAPLPMAQPGAFASNPLLRFPQTTARFLRLRVFTGRGESFIQALSACEETTAPPDRLPVTPLLPPSPSSSPVTTIWQVSLDGATPIDEVDFVTTQRNFFREVSILERNHEGNWHVVGQGSIARALAAGAPTDRVDVTFPENRSREWRVEVINGSNPPLDNVGLRLVMQPQRIVFRQEPGRSYRLLYGQSEAQAPSYDLAQTVSKTDLRNAPLIALPQIEQVNADWVDPRPWSEKHPAVLWLATILAAVILGLAAMRAMRRSA